jgi:hypothetical protein
MVWQIQETHEIAKQTLSQAAQTGKLVDGTNELVQAESKSADTASKQFSAAQEQYQATQRPWMSLDITADKMTVDQNSWGTIGLHYSSSNVGHSLAHRVVFGATLLPDNQRGPECTVPANERQTWDAHHPGTVIFPGQPFTGDTFIRNLVRSPYNPSSGFPRGTPLQLVACIYYESTMDGLVHSTRIAKHVWEPSAQRYYFPEGAGIYSIELMGNGYAEAN